ncbi:MAG: Gfo/Idh/MocA family oxidoreductase [Armatimonadota bacterium]|jgi:predicted dehydrogenase
MRSFRGGLIGCGFFARNHLHAWQEVEGAEIVALSDIDGSRAAAYGRGFEIEGVYGDAEEMLAAETPDFVDIVTGPEAHRPLVELAARHGVHVICQKPLAPSLADARAMLKACREAGVSFMVHENFRWRAPMRAVQEAAAGLGEVFFGRMYWRSAFDICSRQPYLAEDPRFIIYDVGVHLLDLARFYMGEVERLHCETQRVNPKVKGEDVATIVLRMTSGATCLVELSYASKLEEELFPQVLVELEATDGSVRLGPDFRVAVVTEDGVTTRTAGPHIFPWADAPNEATQESVVRIQEHWVACRREGREPETSGADNLRTLELVFGAYESAETGLRYTVGP